MKTSDVPVPCKKKRSRPQGEISTQVSNNKVKFKIPNPTPSNDMGVSTGYVQRKRRLWGKSQECSGSLGKEDQVAF
jgi:hypothetical protein